VPAMDSEHFRIRARQCRELATVARDELSRRQLSDLADELEAEAARIDSGGDEPHEQIPPRAE